MLPSDVGVGFHTARAFAVPLPGPPPAEVQFALPFAAIPVAIGLPPEHCVGVAAKAVAVTALPLPARKVVEVFPKGHSRIVFEPDTLNVQVRKPESPAGAILFKLIEKRFVPLMLTVEPVAGGADHVPSPRQKVVEDAPVEAQKLVTGRTPMTYGAPPARFIGPFFTSAVVIPEATIGWPAVKAPLKFVTVPPLPLPPPPSVSA